LHTRLGVHVQDVAAQQVVVAEDDGVHELQRYAGGVYSGVRCPRRAHFGDLPGKQLGTW
jgi:hypothetical protein